LFKKTVVLSNLDDEARSIIRQKFLFGTSRIVNTFARHGAINSWLDQQAASAGSWVTVYNAGKSVENRDMKVIRFNRGTTQKSIWIDCGIHAREWISPATCIWMIDAVSQ
jgi:murein tripeptide amidase MpaA